MKKIAIGIACLVVLGGCKPPPKPQLLSGNLLLQPCYFKRSELLGKPTRTDVEVVQDIPLKDATGVDITTLLTRCRAYLTSSTTSDRVYVLEWDKNNGTIIQGGFSVDGETSFGQRYPGGPWEIIEKKDQVYISVKKAKYIPL